jgi:hypothetical protein
MDMDDFNFDEFMEESNSDFNAKLEEWRERLMLDAIKTNYEQIEKNGLNEWHLRHMEESELKSLTNTLQIMLEHYQDLEEYEK